MSIRLENAGDSVVRAFPPSAIVLLIASGYARRGRWAFITAGLTALGVSYGWKNRAPKSRTPEVEEKPPVERLLNAIVHYAMRDGATKIRLRAGHGVVVHYLINDKWKEQMRIPPSFAWIKIRVVLKERTGNWKHPTFFEIEEKAFRFMPNFEHEFPLETLTLSLLP